MEARRIPANDAVSWAGTRFGLVPTLSEEAAELLKEGESLVPILCEALNDPERFVTAHVLLTMIARLPHESFPGWNGLAVELPPTGDPAIDPDQRVALARRWAGYCQAAAPASELPSDA